MIKDLIKQLWKDKFARIALVVLGVIYFALLFADFIAPYTKDFSDRTFTLTQYGNTHEKARNQLGMSRYGTDLQSTGIVGRPGQVFKVFVEAEDGAPLPQIVFSQQEGRFGHWKQEYQLKKGLNST